VWFQKISRSTPRVAIGIPKGRGEGVKSQSRISVEDGVRQRYEHILKKIDTMCKR